MVSLCPVPAGGLGTEGTAAGRIPERVQRLQRQSLEVIVLFRALNRKQFCLSCVLECGREQERAGEAVLTMFVKVRGL